MSVLQKAFGSEPSLISFSSAAAKALLVITKKRKCAVCIYDVVPKYVRDEFKEGDTLAFKLKVLPCPFSGRGHYHYDNEQVFVYVGMIHGDLLIGGRVLHYDEGVDGSGFSLMPGGIYQKYLTLTKYLSDEGR